MDEFHCPSCSSNSWSRPSIRRRNYTKLLFPQRLSAALALSQQLSYRAHSVASVLQVLGIYFHSLTHSFLEWGNREWILFENSLHQKTLYYLLFWDTVIVASRRHNCSSLRRLMPSWSHSKDQFPHLEKSVTIVTHHMDFCEDQISMHKALNLVPGM